MPPCYRQKKYIKLQQPINFILVGVHHQIKKYKKKVHYIIILMKDAKWLLLIKLIFILKLL